MELLAMLVLILATGALLVWPLLRPEGETGGSPAAADPAWVKAVALNAIRELEFDYQTGKISPDDYAQLRARYEVKAVEAITRPVTVPNDLDEQLEAAVRAARAISTCVTCGQTLPHGARFCPACGRPVGSDS